MCNLGNDAKFTLMCEQVAGLVVLLQNHIEVKYVLAYVATAMTESHVQTRPTGSHTSKWNLLYAQLSRNFKRLQNDVLKIYQFIWPATFLFIAEISRF